MGSNNKHFYGKLQIEIEKKKDEPRTILHHVY